MMTISEKRRTDSVTRFGYDVNVKSVQEEELFKIYVIWFIIW